MTTVAATVGDRTYPIRIRALCEQVPRSTPTSMAIACIVCVVVWGHVDATVLWLWIAALALIYGLRIAVYLAFRRDANADARPGYWARLAAMTMFASGLVWGGGAVVMSSPAEPLLEAFLLVVICGMAAGGLSANAYDRRAQLAYLLPLLTLPVANLLWEGGPQRTGLATGIALYVVYALAQGGEQARVIRDSIAMRLQNEELVQSLRREKLAAEQARAVAEGAVRDKARFFAAASHDLRQPLHALGLLAGALKAGTREPAQTALLDQVETGIGSLEGLFHELLDVSRLDAGDVRPEPRHFSADRLLRELCAAFAPQAAAQGLALEVLCPTGRAPVWVHADYTMLHRVLSNFIANAIRYTGQGTVALACRRAAGGRWRLEVRDSGPGIAAAEQARIYDEFYQVGNPHRDRSSGLGLGLATVRRLAALMDARLSLRSAPGQGSVFGVVVPAGQPLHIEPAPHAARDLLGDACIAVIDDAAAVRSGMLAILHQWGARAVAGAGPADVLRALDGQAPDLLVCDWMLEGMQGPQAINQVRAAHPGTPALLMTADSSPERLAQARALGLDVVIKPVSAARLRAALGAVLARAHSHVSTSSSTVHGGYRHTLPGGAAARAATPIQEHPTP